MRRIYLDYAATTPLAPCVQEAMLPFLGRHYGDPAALHPLGRASQEAIEDARLQTAELIGADPEEIVFTSCATESNNLALKGVAWRRARAGQGHVVVSCLEHASVLEAARFLQRHGVRVTIVPCNRQGQVDPGAIEQAIAADTVLVSVTHASHELGVVQPLHRIGEICRARGVLLHSDASQSVGKIRTLVDELQVDLLSFSGHKLYAPRGVGVLFVRRGVAVEPLLHGGGQEGSLRSGGENVAAIVGLGCAASLARRALDDYIDRLAMLRDRLYDRLGEGFGRPLPINGFQAERLPGLLSVAFPDVSAAEMLRRTPEVCAAAAAATFSVRRRTSPALTALGLTPEQVRGVMRLTVGWYTSEEDVDRAASLLTSAWERLADAA